MRAGVLLSTDSRTAPRSERGGFHGVDRAQFFAPEVAGIVHAWVPFAPDSNLLCLAINDAAAAAGQGSFCSATILRAEAMGAEEPALIAATPGLDDVGSDPAGFDAERLVILRQTLMNPYLLGAENGISCIDRYFGFLATRVRALPAPAVRAA